MVEEPTGSESELQEIQKLEMLGLMAASVSHHLNNKLALIVGNVDAVFSESGENLRVQAALAEIRLAALQAGEFCRQLVNYSRRGGEDTILVDFSTLIVDLASLLAMCLPKPVALQIACEPALPSVEGHPNQIRQVMINLVINACASLREVQDQVLLRTARVEIDAEFLASLPDAAGARPGPYVLLEVSDTGPGLDARQVEQLFEPFLTPDMGGMGLGLAVVRAIVRAHHGFLQVQSVRGQGTAVQVYWPAVVEPEAAAPVLAETPVAAPEPTADGTESDRGKKVLLIDDDPQILDVTSKMLNKIGYQVVAAPDGVLGVERFIVHRNELSCVILDLNMPYMNGAETLKSLREAGCELPVLVASGFSRLLITQEMRDLGIAAFMEKPFTMEALGRTLDKIFNPGPGLFGTSG
ncbi:MAG: response regulator [Candidatus Methylacidiphilales bacterium]|nr:response regulator [Candidatus Methylacidiphilales bacterium]